MSNHTAVIALAFTLSMHFSALSHEGLKFKGGINANAVDKFLAENESAKPGQTLSIDSQGGEALAAIKLGNWIADRKLNVHVEGLCISACANFVFPAGIEKHISNRGIVVWHGSAEQKDIREWVECHEARSKGASTSLDCTPVLPTDDEKYHGIQKVRLAQAELLKRLGVNEELFRLGQEPVDLGVDGWSASIEVMARYGITNVKATPKYGDFSYHASHPYIKFFQRGRALFFTLDESGATVHNLN